MSTDWSTNIDANTLGSIACIASVNWGCAVQVTAAAAIGSGGNFTATIGKLEYCHGTVDMVNVIICLRPNLCYLHCHSFHPRVSMFTCD